MCCSIVFCSGIRLLLALQLEVDVDAALAGDREAAREVALRRPETGGVLKLAGGVLEAEVEDLLARLSDELDELVVGEIVYLSCLHRPSSSDVAPSRRTNFVRTGSL